MNDHAASAPTVAKAGGIWLAVYFGKLGIQTWSDLAAVVASVYTALLIVGWIVDRYQKWKAAS